MQTRESNRFIRFGTYELDTSTGDLRKSGASLPRLQGQPLEVLLALLARPGEVVTREELRARLWPAHTYVDFDHGLNATINKLREALGDSASNPRFIQTLSRRGYRFIAPVEGSRPEPATESTPEPLVRSSSPSVLSRPEDLPAVPRRVSHLLFSLLQLMYLSFYLVALGHLQHVEFLTGVFRVLPIVVVTAVIGIPIRLYLLAGVVFNYHGLTSKFQKLFPAILIFDELWALAPFLIARQIGFGLAMAATAALLYAPFAERSLLLMGELDSEPRP